MSGVDNDKLGMNRNHSSNLIGSSTMFPAGHSELLQANSILRLDTPLKYSAEVLAKIADVSGL